MNRLLPNNLKKIEEIIPENQNAPFNMHDLINRIIDEDSFCEIKKKFAPELITGLSRINGKSVGIIANQPKMKGEYCSLILLIKQPSSSSFVMHLIFRCYS